MPEGLTDRHWKRILLRHPFRQQLWLYYPAAHEADFQVLSVCDRTGWDAAVLSWHTCTPCWRGHIAKISIAEHWQRQGLGRRLVLRALRGAEDFHWTTTSQSPEAQQFFPILARETGAAFTQRQPVCAHMKAADYGHPEPRFERH
ncbi:GNAT family N-acetyltransferase [Streptomyces sp. NBC_01017]|uniref:GNAT family N-acetyltransferase n=1 Tax=Streptomyces sp. NBC_01017 TaxID=2903721 RepID=UPI003863AD1C|nr:GNAT family N-acetyltransferase [Streptomyces sp. NBC_01017]WSV35363.1 GNAT family N-acetyltransferase [Streptomyces sp. NBC_01017]